MWLFHILTSGLRTYVDLDKFGPDFRKFAGNDISSYSFILLYNVFKLWFVMFNLSPGLNRCRIKVEQAVSIKPWSIWMPSHSHWNEESIPPKQSFLDRCAKRFMPLVRGCFCCPAYNSSIQHTKIEIVPQPPINSLDQTPRARFTENIRK